MKRLKKFLINRLHRLISKYLKITIVRNYPRYSEILIKKNLGDNLIGVEMGVWKGENAKRMLENLPIKKLYLIDPYILYNEWNFNKEMDINNNKEIKEAERKAHKILEKYKDKIVWIKKKSEDCENDIPNDVDFIYLDSSHSYNNLKKELKMSYKKIKKNGILCGHDMGQEEVCKAVGEFSLENKNRLLTSFGEDWGFIK